MLAHSQRILKRIQECQLRNTIYRSINPQLFDVSLRDGIQAASPSKWTSEYKKDIFHYILDTERPSRMEIGSLVSPKILPIMKDSLELHAYVKDYLKRSNRELDVYVLIPSLKQLNRAFEVDPGIQHMSFITSVSNAFQLKNTNRTLDETKTELQSISQRLASSKIKTKLYISCINECPIQGKIDIDLVLREILIYYKEYQFDELCLSDTCGTLDFDDYEYLMDTLIFFGIPSNQLSLHLHVSNTNQSTIRRILWHAFDKHIRQFDVSLIETGGCSVSMSPDKCMPNLSYEIFYDTLDRYIEHHLS